ncbi:hypothetical protein XH89_18270 [Bradyrhizobium sp. CCBAU 53340]|nr:hypothetical protein XH89_18270 [Bradyrhizobium sp. CCBAU 53340]
MSYYFFAACLIVVALSYEVSFRRAWKLSRNYELLGPAQRLALRRGALWPIGYGLICMLLGWVLLHFSQDKLVLYLIMLSASFVAGSFIGVMAGTANRV